MRFAPLALATLGLASVSPACTATPPTPAAPTPTSSPSSGTSLPASDQGKLAVDIASELSEVKLYCASLEQAPQPSHCVLWSEETLAPTAPCEDSVNITGDCLRAVYLGESQPTHTVRFATLHVHLASRTVVAVDDWVCGRMSFAAWKSYQAKVRSASTDDLLECPDGP